MNWISILELIAAAIGTIYGLYWGIKNDYISWDIIKDSLSISGLKETLLTIVQQPLFIALYIFFVLVPTWWLGQYIAPNLPLYYKIGITIGGIWAVNLIMDKKGLK